MTDAMEDVRENFEGNPIPLGERANGESGVAAAGNPGCESTVAAKVGVPRGTETWNTTSCLVRDDGRKIMGSCDAEYVEVEKKFSECVMIQDDEPFTLKPLAVTDGSLKGHRVLLLQPASRADFFVAPPEIRNTIYGLVLEEHDPIQVFFRFDRAMRSTPINLASIRSTQGCERINKSARRLALVQVNKQISQEAGLVFYGRNTFHFEDARALNFFLNGAGSMCKYLASITLLSFGCWTFNNFAASLPVENLRAITIESTDVYLHALSTNDMISVHDLLRELTPFLDRWYVANQARADPKSVLKVVRFADFHKCDLCKEHGASSSEYGCSNSPEDELADIHSAKVSVNFSGQVAMRFGLFR